MGKKVAVVTVTYNSEPVIDGFMQSLLRQTHEEFVLFLIDNASRDRTLALVANYSDSRIVVVANEQNLGVAEGNNQGIRRALDGGFDHVLLINNDTEFDQGLLAGMLEAMQQHKADMLVPKMMFFEPKTAIWCAGGYFKPWMGYVTGHSGEGREDRGQFDAARRIPYAPTCCMLVGIGVFGRVGVMDERYFVYGDDTDFCWRARRVGCALWYDPRQVLYHKVSSLTGGSQSDFTARFATRNKVYFALKNLGPLRIAYSFMLYHVIFFIKLVVRKDSWRIYRLKLRAFMEGIELYKSYRRGGR